MRRRPGGHAADREVVDPDAAHARRGQQLGGLGLDVHEIGVEALAPPLAVGVSGAEQDALAFARLVAGELGRGHGLSIGDLDHACRADRRVEWERVNPVAAVDEMTGRIHVGAGVRAHRQLRDIRRIPPSAMLSAQPDLAPAGRRASGPSRRGRGR